MERDFNLLRKIAKLNKKYHIGLIKYHCDLLTQAPENVIETITNKTKWQRIKKLKNHNKKCDLSIIIDYVLSENKKKEK